MPTRRAFSLLILAAALYLLANQTQVGWVYIMTNMLIGLLLAAFFYAMGLLKGIEGQRSFHNLTKPSLPEQVDDPALNVADFFEDDALEVVLHFTHPKLRPAFLITGQEHCPFAPPTAAQQTFFIPSLFKHRPMTFSYQTLAHRRGLYTFPQQMLSSGGPFNLFRTRHALTVPGEILIYPHYHPLKRLRLLENKGFTDRHVMRAAVSSEVIGTREYRPGDSLRQVHWRSTARTGRLVVKEFADNDHQTITVVLDLSTQGNLGQGKYSTFETAIRIAASLGFYASQQNIPFRLTGRSQQWQPPAMALSWWGTLHYLARVQNDGPLPLAEVLRNLPATPFAVVLVSHPTAQTMTALTALEQKGTRVLAILIAPEQGEIPLAASAQNTASLKIKTTTPHTWAAMLETL